MDIIKEIKSVSWEDVIDCKIQSDAITALENDKILLLPDLSFKLRPSEQELLSIKLLDQKTKNISYDMKSGRLRCANCSPDEYQRLKNLVERFAQNSHSLIKHLFPGYVDSLQIGRTSFRPAEIANRVSSFRKDDTRLHVDAFPSSPIQGRRILRVFTNINPHGQDRIWRIGEPFFQVANQFLPRVSKSTWPGKAKILQALKITKSYRTPYDHIMLQIHDTMKADMNYQKSASQCKIAFSPGNTWIVQTDSVSHAAMSGQHALEQTFYLPVSAMVTSENSPLRILEKLTGRSLV